MICVCDEHVFRMYSEGNARSPVDVTIPLLPIPFRHHMLDHSFRLRIGGKCKAHASGPMVADAAMRTGQVSP